MSEETSLSKSNLIAKNTSLLYLRMMVVMFINLFAVRILLNSLGTEDYGIYNVVAGVVTMLVCVTAVLSTATQRYLSFALGEKDYPKLKNLFSASMNIYLALSIVVLLLGETIGLWFVNNYLVIPESRMLAANIIYQFSIFSFIATILIIPYTAAVIAHENMGIYAVVSTVDCLLKFTAASILIVLSADLLIVYVLGLLITSLIILASYYTICKRKYSECSYSRVTDKSIYRELLSFSGWTFFGSVANVGMIQVNTILINLFFGPIVNAARAISLQVYNVVTSFCNSFIMAIRPPMIKSYAENDFSYLMKTFNLSNKVIYYCLLLICVPLYLEMNTILSVWLNISDELTVLFSRLILIYTVIITLHNPITIIIQASGNVKNYYVPVETFTLLSVPVTYVMFKLGFKPESTIEVMIAAAIVSHLIRLICLKRRLIDFKITNYLKEFVFPAIIITSLVVFISYLAHTNTERPFIRLIIVTVLSILSTTTIAYVIGFNKVERSFIQEFTRKLLFKYGSRK